MNHGERVPTQGVGREDIDLREPKRVHSSPGAYATLSGRAQAARGPEPLERGVGRSVWHRAYVRRPDPHFDRVAPPDSNSASRACIASPGPLQREVMGPIVSRAAAPAPRTASVTASPDDLVGPQHDGLGDGQPERLRSLEVDDQLVLRRLLDGKVGGLHALEDLVRIYSEAPEDLGGI